MLYIRLRSKSTICFWRKIAFLHAGFIGLGQIKVNFSAIQPLNVPQVVSHIHEKFQQHEQDFPSRNSRASWLRERHNFSADSAGFWDETFIEWRCSTCTDRAGSWYVLSEFALQSQPRVECNMHHCNVFSVCQVKYQGQLALVVCLFLLNHFFSVSDCNCWECCRRHACVENINLQLTLTTHPVMNQKLSQKSKLSFKSQNNFFYGIPTTQQLRLKVVISNCCPKQQIVILIIIQGWIFTFFGTSLQTSQWDW